MHRNEVRCAKCGAASGVLRVERCPICHRNVCLRCALRRHGKIFCGPACAEYFFFGNPDEDA